MPIIVTKDVWISSEKGIAILTSESRPDWEKAYRSLAKSNIVDRCIIRPKYSLEPSSIKELLTTQIVGSQRCEVAMKASTNTVDYLQVSLMMPPVDCCSLCLVNYVEERQWWPIRSPQ